MAAGVPNETRRVVLEDIARQAGVSRSTASRALVDDPRISLATRTRVKKVAGDLRYVPNAAARSLRVRRTHTFGLLLADLSDPVHGQVASGFEQEAGEGGYRVIIVAGLNDPLRERRALKIFTEYGADGVAIVSSVITPSEAQARVQPDRLVVVQPDHRSLYSRRGPLPPGVIRTDDAAGVQAAVEHLVLNGYRNIAYVESGVRGSNSVRREAVQRALRARGIHRPLRRFPAPDDAWRSPDELARRIAADLPEALVCYDDKLALALMNALRDLGIRAPQEVGIVGFDGIPFAAISNPRLTTVATPTGELGRLAASSLIAAIQTGSPPSGALLPVELVVRESTRSTISHLSEDLLRA
jgi:DNA-binding LacI/PurR family transcriptional regulator